MGALKAFLEREGCAVQCLYEYLRVAELIGFDIYQNIAESAYELGELLYIPTLYPDRRDVVRDKIVATAYERIVGAIDLGRGSEIAVAPSEEVLLGICDQLFAGLGAHLSSLVERTVGVDVVGLTTSFGQLFANLAYAQGLKQRSPDTLIVLGGSTVSSRVGPSILREYPFIDAVVQGEGEQPFAELLRCVGAGRREDISSIRGVLCRDNLDRLGEGASFWEVEDMNTLPYPDYDEYAALAGELNLPWRLPIEGSRGCWWDRVKKTGNARNTCYFCNLNVQWSGYREKKVDHIVEEVATLSDKYEQTELFFLDNIIRARGIGELADNLAALGREFDIFYEMRANISPLELAQLKRAGLSSVQIGVEGLATSYLQRVGKGTKAIQNLQAMKTIFELRIGHYGNIIVDFPGATEEEIEETWRNLTTYAICFEPLNCVPFVLGVGSTVATLKDEFPVRNVRNNDIYAECIPEGVNLQLLDLSFDLAPEAPSWELIKEFSKRWTAGRVDRLKPVLYYRDGGEYLNIYDERGALADIFAGFPAELPFIMNRPRRCIYTLKGAAARLYLYCAETRSIKQILAAFGADWPDKASLLATLDEWVKQGLMFNEGHRYLSMAVATTPELAMKRIEGAAQSATVDGSVQAGEPLYQLRTKRSLPTLGR